MEAVKPLCAPPRRHLSCVDVGRRHRGPPLERVLPVRHFSHLRHHRRHAGRDHLLHHLHELHRVVQHRTRCGRFRAQWALSLSLLCRRASAALRYHAAVWLHLEDVNRPNEPH
jgi:hypothetical protein